MATLKPITDWKEVVIDGKVKMKIPGNLDLIKKVGSGAYGTVASFQDPAGNKVAVKKITDAFHDLVDGKRILREVKLLRFMKHDNISCILDLYPPDHPDFDDIYIVTDLMETDLHRVIYSKQVLNEEHHQYFSYQILRGLLYMHSANVVHRDLKPSNILVNKNCDLKICDFGLARVNFSSQEFRVCPMTEYVCTRWYRAPEVLCSWTDYSTAIDVWSIGCIFAEMLGRNAIFPGHNTQHQLQLILAFLGTPLDEEVQKIPNEKCRRFIRNMPPQEAKPISETFPDATADGINLLSRMLNFDPDKRLLVDEALAHTFLEQLHCPEDEPVREPLDTSEFEFERRKITVEALREELFLEALKYYPEREKEYIEEQEMSDRKYSINHFRLLEPGESQYSSDAEGEDKGDK
jgi:mitogen-activated protein kinase 1/3